MLKKTLKLKDFRILKLRLLGLSLVEMELKELFRKMSQQHLAV